MRKKLRKYIDGNYTIHCMDESGNILNLKYYCNKSKSQCRSKIKVVIDKETKMANIYHNSEKHNH